MLRQTHRKSLQIDLLPSLEDISPWDDTPKLKPLTHKSNSTRLDPTSSQKRLSLFSRSREHSGRPKSSRVSKPLSMATIEFFPSSQSGIRAFTSISS